MGDHSLPISPSPFRWGLVRGIFLLNGTTLPHPPFPKDEQGVKPFPPPPRRRLSPSPCHNGNGMESACPTSRGRHGSTSGIADRSDFTTHYGWGRWHSPVRHPPFPDGGCLLSPPQQLHH